MELLREKIQTQSSLNHMQALEGLKIIKLAEINLSARQTQSRTRELNSLISHSQGFVRFQELAVLDLGFKSLSSEPCRGKF